MVAIASQYYCKIRVGGNIEVQDMGSGSPPVRRVTPISRLQLLRVWIQLEIQLETKYNKMKRTSRCNAHTVLNSSEITIESCNNDNDMIAIVLYDKNTKLLVCLAED